LIMGSLLAFSSCSKGDEQFILQNETDSLSYATAIKVTSEMMQFNMPNANPAMVRKGAENFLDSTLEYDINTCLNTYRGVVQRIQGGTLNVADEGEEIKALQDSLGYSIGALIANTRKMGNMVGTNPLALEQAFKDFADSTMQIPVKTCLEMYDAEDQEAQMRQMAERKAAMEAAAQAYLPNKEIGEKFLEENLSAPGIATTPSGLQYRVIKEGSGSKPVLNSRVKVHYTGKTIDGKVFDSSVERGEPAEFALNRVIRGWTEGLMLMSEGAKYELYVPQELAYGLQSPSPDIKPYSMLIFEVELLEILQP